MTGHISHRMNPEIREWLALWRTQHIGPISFRNLLEQFGSASVALRQSAARLESAGLRAQAIKSLATPDWEGVDRDLRWAEGAGREILLIEDPRYPERLKQIADPPPILFVEGRIDALSDPQTAIVGSRNPSPGGRRMGATLAADLARAGVIVTSGLALGIDGEAHKGALSAGGLTVAVAASGPDLVYPARHKALALEIREHGALISEFPVGTQPLPEHFPRRNRLISGLSLGVVVVEAALKSGSLITARMALEQGRELFAVPGAVSNPLAAGCHRLIREGAKLVECAEHVLEDLAPILGAFLTETPRGDQPAIELDAAVLRLLVAIGYDASTIDEVILRSGLSAEQASAQMLQLELDGLVERDAHGRYVRIA